MRVKRPMTNFFKLIREIYRVYPDFKKQAKELWQGEKDRTTAFGQKLERLMQFEDFRKLLETEIAAHRKIEESIKRGIEQSRRGEFILRSPVHERGKQKSR